MINSGDKVKKIVTIGFTVLLASCAQFVTDDDERSELRASADARADEFVACVQREADGFGPRNASEAPVVAQTAALQCDAEMAAYRQAEKAFLESKALVTGKPLEAAVADLNLRAQNEVALQLLSAPAQQEAAASSDYFTCMSEEAARFIALPETAADIATAANARCRAYLADDPDAAQAEESGRAKVMAQVMDARAKQ